MRNLRVVKTCKPFVGREGSVRAADRRKDSDVSLTLNLFYFLKSTCNQKNRKQKFTASLISFDFIDKMAMFIHSSRTSLSLWTCASISYSLSF